MQNEQQQPVVAVGRTPSNEDLIAIIQPTTSGSGQGQPSIFQQTPQGEPVLPPLSLPEDTYGAAAVTLNEPSHV